jgi:hypothetical protein
MPNSATMRYLSNSVRNKMGVPLKKQAFEIKVPKLGQGFSLLRATPCLCAAVMFYVHFPLCVRGFSVTWHW